MRAIRAALYAGICTATCFLAAPASADVILNGSIYFTHWTGGENVWTDTYSYNQTTQTLTMGVATGIAAVNGADGIIFDAYGHLLVGGQGYDVIHMLNTDGTLVANEPLRDQSYHLALDPTGNFVYTSNFGGPLITAPLTSSGFGGSATLTPITGGDTGVTQIAFDPITGQVFYDTSNPNCCGNFGTINLATGVTTRLGTNQLAVHGMIFDPLTGLITFFGDGYVGTYNPATNTYKQHQIYGGDFDQGAVDGLGHAFVVGSDQLTFIDYSISGDITNPDKVIFKSDPGFVGIDDIAPLAGIGSRTTVPEPFTLSLFGAGLAGMVAMRRRKKQA